MKKILIAEDVSSTYHTLRNCLDKNAYLPLRAIDPYEAIELAGRDRPDLVLMDIEFRNLEVRDDIPRNKLINGLGSAVQIYSRYDVPVAFLTHHGTSALLNPNSLNNAVKLSDEDHEMVIFIKDTFGFIEKDVMFRGGDIVGQWIDQAMMAHRNLSTSQTTFSLDEALRFTALSQKAAQLFDYTLNDLKGKNIWDAASIEPLKGAMQKNRSTMRARLTAKNHGQLEVEMDVQPIKYSFGNLNCGLRCTVKQVEKLNI